MKYRKKPVVIEAFRFQIDKAMPDWFNEKRITNEIVTHDDGTVEIKTLEGMMKANKGDYIIQGVNGEIYPCKPDIFEKTYDEVVEITPKEALKNILDYVNLDEYDYETKGIRNAEMLLKQALNDLERLKKFKETFDNYELSKRQDFVAFENWLECEKELVVIKSDVKRFMELLDSQEEHDEFSLLYNKLLEVCAEEE